jgi:hypothetical protein
MTGVVHLLKERKGRDVTAKCGVKSQRVTIWASDVTCVLCLGMMAGEEHGGEHRATL